MCLFDIGASYGGFSLAAAHFGGTAGCGRPLSHRHSAHETGNAAQSIGKKHSNRRSMRHRIKWRDSDAEFWRLLRRLLSRGPSRLRSELTKTAAVTIDQLADQFGAP